MTWFGWFLGLIVFFALLSLGASRLLYYPMRYPAGEWSIQQSLGAQDVWLTTTDGTKLHGWWIAAPAARMATLHLHGNAGNITHREYAARHVLAAGSSVLLLDYRGYGKSAGRPAEKGLYQDAQAAYEYLTRTFAPERIMLHGESLGTAIATWLASERPCGGVVLEAPFTSASAVAGKVLPVLGPLLVRAYNSLGRIKRVKAPVLIIHGDRDEVIAFEFGQQLFEAANDPKFFWRVPGATHNDLHLIGGPEFSRRLAEFYRATESANLR